MKTIQELSKLIPRGRIDEASATTPWQIFYSPTGEVAALKVETTDLNSALKKLAAKYDAHVSEFDAYRIGSPLQKAALKKAQAASMTEAANPKPWQIRLRWKGDDKIVADNVMPVDLNATLDKLEKKHKVDRSEFEMFRHGTQAYKAANAS